MTSKPYTIKVQLLTRPRSFDGKLKRKSLHCLVVLVIKRSTTSAQCKAVYDTAGSLLVPGRMRFCLAPVFAGATTPNNRAINDPPRSGWHGHSFSAAFYVPALVRPSIEWHPRRRVFRMAPSRRTPLQYSRAIFKIIGLHSHSPPPPIEKQAPNLFPFLP